MNLPTLITRSSRPSFAANNLFSAIARHSNCYWQTDAKRFISAVSRARKPSPIREATALLLRSPPSTISLGGGNPNPSTFPFETITVTTKNGSCINFDETEMKRALQYSESIGIPELQKWIRDLHAHYHNPLIMQSNHPAGFQSCITAGSQDGLAKVFDMLLSPGDSLLLDNPNYSGTLAYLKPMPIKLLPVETDEYGMKSSSLRERLSKWKPTDSKCPNSGIPKVIYTIPNCGNPTGATASLARKKEIYQIAQEYDLIIVEDDPYYFLQFDDNVPKSYQALDVDGRVLRSDSMSKVMSSGLRLGWISGAKPFLERIILHQQSTILHNSTLTQMLVVKLWNEWGMDGFQRHVNEVKKFYKYQRDIIIESANKWLKGLAEWVVPQGGMFLWIKLNGIEDTKKMIEKLVMEKEVILIPGSCFDVEEDKKSSYVRASFSLSSPEDIDQGIQRLAELVKEEKNL